MRGNASSPLRSPPGISRLPEAATSAAMVVRRNFALHAGTRGQRWITRRNRTPGSSSTICCGKPAGIRPIPEGNPVQLICETLTLEREILTGLEKLLKEIEE